MQEQENTKISSDRNEAVMGSRTDVKEEEDTTDLVRIAEKVTEISEKAVRRPAIVQAPLPSRPFPDCKAGVSLLAFILISKYADHLSFYRIRQHFERQQFSISDSTLGSWVKMTLNYLIPLYDCYQIHLLRSPYLQIAETTLKVLEDGKEKTHLGYLWAIFDPVHQLPFFFYKSGRSRQMPVETLQSFSGHLQCDDYAVYDALAKKRPEDITLVNCMAHIRREFVEAKSNDANRAETAISFIKILYHVEEEARTLQLDHQQRLELRQRKARDIFQRFNTWLDEQATQVLPQSRIGKAIQYARNRMPNMERYLNDGKIEIDTHLVENAIRPVAIGRKNYLFAGSHEGAQRSAIAYTFFAACQQHGINHQVWLPDVLNRLYLTPVNQIEQFLPQFWKPQESKP